MQHPEDPFATQPTHNDPADVFADYPPTTTHNPAPAPHVSPTDFAGNYMSNLQSVAPGQDMYSGHPFSVEPPVEATAPSVFQQALQAGVPVVSDPEHTIDPRAARLLPHPLPEGVAAVPLAVAGDVLSVVCPELPTPGQFRTMESIAGCLVTICLAPPEVYERLVERYNHMRISGVSASGSTASTDPNVPMLMDAVLREAIERGASDVHLSVARPPMIRVDGELAPSLNGSTLSQSDLDAAAVWLGSTPELGITEHETTVLAAGSRWRVSLYRQRHGKAVALRRIPVGVPRLEDLGVPPAVASLSSLRSGLVLVCGPTGSGKSTTLAAVVGQINRSRNVHIVTIEDPVEYQHTSVRALVHQREVGHDTEGFATALRAALRQDPDVVLVGELRDLETMTTAIQAAETGHLVLTTVHAGSAVEAYSRIIDAFPAAERSSVRSLLATNVRAILAQQLLPAVPRGRALAAELLLSTPALRACIREDRLHEVRTILETGVSLGMTSMDRSLAALVSAGRIELGVALDRCEDQASFTDQLNHFTSKAEQW